MQSRPRRLPALLSLAASFLLAGCSTAPTAPRAAYVEEFQSGRYAESYESASRIAGSMRSTDRDHAALIAGLSAQALDRNDEAERWLTPLARNSDPALGGKAAAALGLIAQERGRHAQAADLLTTAGRRLPGDEGARALMYAADSLRIEKKVAESQATYKLAQAKVQTDPALRAMIGDRLSGAPIPTTTARPAGTAGRTSTGGYTVQIGAFADQRTAQRQAGRVRASSPARTTQITDRAGNRLYAVRVGRYGTRQEAEQARRSIGGRAIVTAATGE